MTRTPLFAALLLGLVVVGSTCGGGTLDPATDPGAGGASGAQDGGQACGPVCEIFCAYGNVLDANGCPTCSCKPDPGCPTVQVPCGRIFCPYGVVTDANGCHTCECAAGPVCDGVAPEACLDTVPPRCPCDPGLACAASECGGPPPPIQAAPCPDGTVPPFECVRNDDRRTCGWHIRACPVITI